MNGLLLFILITILVIILLYSFQIFSKQPLGNNNINAVYAISISKELESDLANDDSSLVQISSEITIPTTETSETIIDHQFSCPEGFFINQTINKCQERPPTPTLEEYFNEGYKQSQMGNYELAIEYYDKAIELDPNLAMAYYNKGLSLESLGRFREAISNYEQALSINPSYKSHQKDTN